MFNCNRKCDPYEEKRLTGKIENYFGVYKLDNWWIYSNQALTKRDSVYITNFNEAFDHNRTVCEKIEERQFKIVNKFLTDGNPLFVIYRAGGNAIHVNFSFDQGQTQSAGFPQFTYFLDTDTIASFPSPDNPGINIADSISLNGTKYYNILIGKERTNTFYFAKEKGLVGWGTILDTFNLIDFKIF
jgi:hypothetical protein